MSRSGGGLISRFGRPSAVRLSRRIGGKAPEGRRTGAELGLLVGLGGTKGVGVATTGGAMGLGAGGALPLADLAVDKNTCSGGNVLNPFSNVACIFFPIFVTGFSRPLNFMQFSTMRLKSSTRACATGYSPPLTFFSIVEISIGRVTISKYRGMLSLTGSTGSRNGVASLLFFTCRSRAIKNFCWFAGSRFDMS